MRIKAKIGQKGDDFTWTEDFTVSSPNSASKEIQHVIDMFNDSLRPGEKERYIIELIPFEMGNIYDFYKEVERFISSVSRESENAFGSAWCKENLNKITKLASNIEKKGGITKFKRVVNESPFKEEFEELLNYKEKPKPKEKYKEIQIDPLEDKEIENCILCIRCKDTEEVFDGSIKKKCVRCNEDVWVSPASQSLKVDITLCTTCLRPDDISNKDNNFVITPQVHEEFNYWLTKKREETRDETNE